MNDAHTEEKPLELTPGCVLIAVHTDKKCPDWDVSKGILYPKNGWVCLTCKFWHERAKIGDLCKSWVTATKHCGAKTRNNWVCGCTIPSEMRIRSGYNKGFTKRQ